MTLHSQHTLNCGYLPFRAHPCAAGPNNLIWSGCGSALSEPRIVGGLWTPPPTLHPLFRRGMCPVAWRTKRALSWPSSLRQHERACVPTLTRGGAGGCSSRRATGSTGRAITRSPSISCAPAKWSSSTRGANTPTRQGYAQWFTFTTILVLVYHSDSVR